MYAGQTRLEDIRLDDLPKLSWLDMSLVDAGKVNKVLLRNMPTLNMLHIEPTAGGNDADVNHRTNMGDDALRHVDTFKNLGTFEMRFSKITDRTLEKLKDLKRLGTIDLDHNDITDAGLQHLRGLDRLLFLNVYHTKITKEAKADLMKTIRERRQQREGK